MPTWRSARRLSIVLGVASSRGAWLSPHAYRLEAVAGLSAARGCRRAYCSVAYGEGMSQDDMMEKDMLILVDGEDRITGAMSKREAHEFSAATPRGWLHRAFSVFLFDSQGRMVLTKRADSKITFPGVWTNACCSHPLHGRVPDEVDRGDDPTMPAAKHAARRKLQHELGIAPEQVPHDGFHYLTRFHYWAADTLTYGADAPWGEHEVDYILLAQADVDMAPNADEVSEVRHVTAEQLRGMLAQPELRWSPWFVGIMERGGWAWWAELDEAMRPGGRFVDGTVTYFDAPPEHHAAYNLPSHDRSTGVRQLAAEPAAEAVAV